MSDFGTSLEGIPDAIGPSDIVLTHLLYSFLAGLGGFIIFVPFYCSRKSFFDALAARNTMRIIQLFVMLEFLAIVMLFYYYFSLGSPINLHMQWGYGNGDSWLYGFGRPTCTFIFVCVIGHAADMHPFIRLLVMAGCIVQMMGDSLSAYQVRDYYQQIQGNAAPSNGYSNANLMAYYWRDIASFGFCTTILLQVALLTCVVGWWPPQLIHPSLISGGGMNRFEVMHEQRDRRKRMEQRGFLGPVPQPRKVKPTISAMLLASRNVSSVEDGKSDERKSVRSSSIRSGGGGVADEEQPLVREEDGKEDRADGDEEDDEEDEEEQQDPEAEAEADSERNSGRRADAGKMDDVDNNDDDEEAQQQQQGSGRHSMRSGSRKGSNKDDDEGEPLL